jgi:hypothetical protein
MKETLKISAVLVSVFALFVLWGVTRQSVVNLLDNDFSKTSKILGAEEKRTNDDYYVYYQHIDLSSQNTDFDINPLGVFPVKRTIATSDKISYLIEELIKGPTKSEQEDGYFHSLGFIDQEEYKKGNFERLKVDSNWKAQTLFEYTIDGNHITINFKGSPYLVGDMSGGVMREQIRFTLGQLGFSEFTVKFNNSKCWDDLSGLCVD